MKVRTIIVTAGALLALAGCSATSKHPTAGTSTPASTTVPVAPAVATSAATATTAPATTTPKATTAQTTTPAPPTKAVPSYSPTTTKFLNATHFLKHTSGSAYSNTDRIKTGKLICRAFDVRDSYADALHVTSDLGLSAGHRSNLLQASVAAFCSGQTGRLHNGEFLVFLKGYPHGGLSTFTDAGYSHGDLESTARTICAAYGRGASISAVVGDLDKAFDDLASRWFAAGSQAVYCLNANPPE